MTTMIQVGIGEPVTCEGEPADRDAWKSMELRAERNHKLAETDWWGRSDMTMTSDQTAYCKALRDLPATVGDDILNWPNITWPTKP